MNIFTERRHLLDQFRKQQDDERAARLHSSGTASVLSLEISAVGVGWRHRRKGQSTPYRWEKATSYEQAQSLAATTIQEARLQPGMVVNLYLWPPNMKVFSMMVGPGQRTASALLLDELVQVNPEALQLDSHYSYRVLDNGTKKVEVIGLGNHGQEVITSALPPGVKLTRQLGSLKVLAVLLEKVANKIPDPALICFLESNRLQYFGLRKGSIAGVRVVARNSLRDANDLKNTLNSMQVDPPNILFVGLTEEANDAEAICQAESEHNEIETSMTDRSALLLEYPEFDPCPPAAQIPLSLVEPRNSSKVSQPLFYTVEEAKIIPLVRGEMAFLKFTKYFSTISLLLALSAVIWSGVYLAKTMQAPFWKVDPEKVHLLEKEWATFTANRLLYARMVDQIEANPRLDRLAAVICAPTPEDITLETVTFTNKSSPSIWQKTSYQIEGSGLSKNGDIAFMKSFVDHLRGALQEEHAASPLTGEVTSTTLDAQAMTTRFNFTLSTR